MRKSMPSNQTKALTIAMAGATVAAITTMFVPASMLEGLTGATGISEIVPPAAAPLGDTARALIAFSAGAFTLAVLAYFLLRQDAVPIPADGPQAMPSLQSWLARITLPNMPWSKSDDDITELSDLPKLRNGDVHPDAPPRRPLSAQQDLAAFIVEEKPAAGSPIQSNLPVAADANAADDEGAADASAANETAEGSITADTGTEIRDVEPTLAEMVAQLEAAVADRQQQLMELESVAARLGNSEGISAPKPAEQVVVEDKVEPARTGRPLLEAVPTGSNDDAIDSALEAALATLHRMNGTTR